MNKRVRSSVAGPRLWTRILLVFGGGALVLSAVGVFGNLAYYVRRQRREIGVRMALGADRGLIVGLVVRRGLIIAAAGIVVGLGLSLVVSRSLDALLFEVGHHDPLTFLLACGTLAGVALIACYMPARRAANIDPKDAMASR